MLKHYLVASTDDSIIHWEPKLVAAESSEDALQKYLRVIYSKDEVFRESVLDLTINFGFVSRFILETPEEHRHYNKKGSVITKMSTVHQRVRKFFATEYSFAERFLQYMKTQNPTLIDNDMYAYIAATEPEGLIAVDLESIERI
ncbi:hypothetical protein [Duganella sacchari]|uniref:hypothetical protein n=1 Tax=Duganella sacchari TaxID=551987 RepID=UPI001114CB4D|nr:hypothetical protein [Duganella sacchari]